MGYSALNAPRSTRRVRLGPDAALDLTRRILEAAADAGAWESVVRGFGELMHGESPDARQAEPREAGVRRQADLVRLVLSGASGLGLRRG